MVITIMMCIFFIAMGLIYGESRYDQGRLDGMRELIEKDVANFLKDK